MPIVGRGAGTGLSGGAIPRAGRHDDRLRAHEPHSRNRSRERARGCPARSGQSGHHARGAEPTAISTRPILPASGPAPSAATSPKTPAARTRLAYGVTTNHVLGLEVVLPDRHGRRQPAAEELDLPGYDLTRPAHRLGRHHGAGHQDRRAPDAQAGSWSRPCSLSTTRCEDAGSTVAEHHRARHHSGGASKCSMASMLRMVEEATHAGYPMDAAAVLLIEVEGLARTSEEQVEQIREAVPDAAARASSASRSPQKSATCYGRAARTPSARWAASARLTTCRMAWCRAPQIAPTRSQVIGEVGEKYGLTISNIFHAGDGNMHPIILFDRAQAGRSGTGAAGRRRDSGTTASRSAARSPASTAWAWKRWR